jgi:membrane protein implicated in regulation of membrane protease activity
VTTFLIVGGLGLVLLLVSLVLGDLLDGVFDALTGDIFSSAVLGGFVAAFGFGAALVQDLTGSAAVGGVAGIGFGAAAAVGTIGLTRLVKDGASDGTLTAADSLGRSGRVIGQIPEDGLGTVRLAIGGHTVQLNARADRPIEAGTEVHVTEILSPTSVRVAPVWNELPGSDVPEVS